MIELFWLIALVLVAPLLLRVLLDFRAGRRSEAREAARPARQADVYDGHANYRAEIESPQSRLSATGRSASTQLMTFAAAVAGACLANWLFWPMGPDATNIGRVFAFIGMILGFLFGMLCYITAAVGVFPGQIKRVALAAAVVLAAAIWLLKERSDGVLEERAQRQASFRAEHAARREVAIAWRKRIDELGLHGTGDPPMLSVARDGEWLRVTNTSSTRIECVEVRRVGSLGARRVASGLSTERGHPCLPIAGGATIAYRDWGDEAQRMRLSLEFRIGTPEKPDPTWWSDSALRQFDTDFEHQNIYRIP